MPCLVDALTKYRKHKASSQAVVTLNGRDYYLGPYGTSASKAFYDRLIAEWLIQGRSAQAPTVDAITVAFLCGHYLRFAKSYYLKDGKCTGTVPAIKSNGNGLGRRRHASAAWQRPADRSGCFKKHGGRNKARD